MESHHNSIDSEAAETARCPKHDCYCVYRGMKQAGKGIRGYRAFAVCPEADCDYYTEF